MEVIADHFNPGEHIRAVANQGGAFDWPSYLPIFNKIRFRGGKNELAVSDIHLTAPKVHGIEPTLNAGDDFLRIAIPGPHVGIGHPRHGQVRVGFATPVARRPRPGQTGIEGILQVAFENAIFNQRRALGRSSFIIDFQTAAAASQRTIIDNRDARRRDPLTDPATKGAGPLAVEVTLETMANGLMQ